MAGRSITLIGATGLIGSHLLELLSRNEQYPEIKLIVRRPFAFSGKKVKTEIIDFSDLTAFKKCNCRQ